MRLAIGILMVLCVAQGQAGPAPLAEIPFEHREGLIWISVTARQSPKPLNFLVDTGAGVSTINLYTARRLGLKLGERVRVRGVQTSANGYWPQRISASAGEVALPSDYLAVDLCALSQACNCEVDGLLGADFFANRIVQIDFEAQKIRALPARLPAASAVVLPLKASTRRLQVPVGVNGQQPVWMRVDTGCATALQWVGKAPRATAQSSQLSIGLSPVNVPEVSATVQLGTEIFHSVPVGLHSKPLFVNEGGLLGNGLLSRFGRITIDAKRGALLLEPRRK